MRPDELSELKDRALAAAAEGITIADARQPDNPLIYVNSGFERLTGYSVSEVLGRNCRFLQGPGTDQAALDRLRAAIRDRRECTIQLLNYRKDGATFWNRLSITPVRDETGEVTHFIGVQSDVTEQKLTQDKLEDASRIVREDLRAAALVQRSLLPGKLPSAETTNVAWEFRPSTELAGDILNVSALDDRHLALYVLDVSGHGVASALLAVTVSRLLAPIPGQSFLYTPAADGGYDFAPPAEVLRRLNRHFPFDPRTAQYFTIFFGILETQTGELRYSLAGHPDPVYVPCGERARTIQTGGIPVGILPNAQYADCVLRLEPGDRLYIYTDGIVEAENSSGQEFGLDRLIETLGARRAEPLDRSLAAAMARVEEWSGSASGLADDVSMLAIERCPVAGHPAR